MNGYNKVGMSNLAEMWQESCSGVKNKHWSSASWSWPSCGLFSIPKPEWQHFIPYKCIIFHKTEDMRHWGAGFAGFFSSCFLLGSWVCCVSPLAFPGISPGPGTSVVPGCWSLATDHWDARADGINAQSGAWEEAFFMFLALPKTSWWQRCVTHGQLSCFFHGWKPGREAGDPHQAGFGLVAGLS